MTLRKNRPIARVAAAVTSASTCAPVAKSRLPVGSSARLSSGFLVRARVFNAVSSRSATTSRPVVGRSSPPMTLSSVVLPKPEGP